MRLSDKHIDAVITWVDGNDPEHTKKRNAVLRDFGGHDDEELVTGHEKTRFIDNGELKYCLLSLRKFAPWLRHIYLITDKQRPDFLSDELMRKLDVHIVDHSTLFSGYEWAMPTFNSRTIETALWRVPKLAPRFVYLNDDFILTSPVQPEDFFTDDKVILRGQWDSAINYGPFRLKINDYISRFFIKAFGITRSMHLLLQIRSAKLAGFIGEYYRAPHVPHPLKTETLRSYFDKHPGYFKKNIQYKFRSKNQFSAIYLGNHLEIINNKAVLIDADDALMINGEVDLGFIINQKLKKIRSKQNKFLCLQGFESLKEEKKKKVRDTLNQLIGDDF